MKKLSIEKTKLGIKTAYQSALMLVSGLKYVLNTGWIKKYIALAVLINIVSFGLSILVVFLVINSLTFQLIQELQLSTDMFVVAFIQALIFVISVVLSVISFTTISSIISAPIWGIISERVLKETSAIEVNQRNWVDEVTYTASFQSKRLLLIGFIFVVTLPLNLIPILGQILFSIINFIQLILITGLDLFEPVWGKTEVGFRNRIKLIIKNPAKYWPFLTVAGFLSAIPVVNIVTIPICITAAILLEVNNLHQQKEVK